MPKNAFWGDEEGRAREIKSIYIGDEQNRAREVKSAFIGDENGVARQWWPNRQGLFANGQGFQMRGSGWQGHIQWPSVYHNWINAFTGYSSDFGNGYWAVSGINGFDPDNLPLYNMVPPENYWRGRRHVLSGGAIGLLPPARVQLYWYLYNSKANAHRHDLCVWDEEGVLRYFYYAAATRTFNQEFDLDFPHYIGYQYTTDDGWAAEAGNSTFQYIKLKDL